ncbi:hypothetical protein C0099_11600 [Pseudazoarcus pumilus]|uniref:Glycosyl hydrolase family 32 N-terminal domain-containing protein n=2 Tax=Pseudazoarcus pumilus TaxID=2067960 RepID=A0A2I6S8C9_9RHOO|nr:hypothetical protein C0099_11600 [Pseudazoarcus pumilus]
MRNAVGVAISEDGGYSFRRMFEGPVLDRTRNEPYYVGAAEVFREGNHWKCYYTCGNEWKVIDGKPEIDYQIKYATSHDGIEWHRDNLQVIRPEHDFEVCARPSVWWRDGLYHMLFSRRSMAGFRVEADQGYRAGYARSSDGIMWQRHDSETGLDPSADGWDSEGIAYPYHFELFGRELLIYNGNQFGRSGFGIAERLHEEGSAS